MLGVFSENIDNHCLFSIPDGYIADSCFQECTRLSISIIAMGFRYQDLILKNCNIQCPSQRIWVVNDDINNGFNVMVLLIKLVTLHHWFIHANICEYALGHHYSFSFMRKALFLGWVVHISYGNWRHHMFFF